MKRTPKPARTGCGVALSRLSQEGDDLLSIFARREATIRLHAVAGYDLVGVCNEAVELFFIPDEACLLHRAGKAVVRQRPCFPSDNLMQVGAQPIVALFHHVTRSAGVVEGLLPCAVLRALRRLRQGGRQWKHVSHCAQCPYQKRPVTAPHGYVSLAGPEPGKARDQVPLPHSITSSARGRIKVAVRGNVLKRAFC